jgi:serine/threonine-protein kinase
MGAMGVVVAAQHIALRERVALKFLKTELLESRTILARFEREARAATRIKSEHIARVRDVGHLETGEPYMVMEYLEGRDLSAYVRERGPLPLGEASDYVLQVCEALAEAHALGIVHRDLKPENLFLTRRPDGSACVKVLDFGISKFSDAGGGTSSFAGTVAGGLVGSPLYMSPEQISASPDVDARSDVWGLGVILFELLTGKTPFTGTSLPQVCLSITARPPRSLSALRPEIPLRVEKLVLQCLEKDRSRRLSSVAEVARRLAEFGTNHGRISAARAARIAAGAGASSSSEAVAPSSRAMAATQISVPPRIPEGGTVPRLAIAVGAAGVALLGAVLALFGSRGTVRSAETGVAPQPPAVTAPLIAASATLSVEPPPAPPSADAPPLPAPSAPLVSVVQPPVAPATSATAKAPRRATPARRPILESPAPRRNAGSPAHPPPAPEPDSSKKPPPLETLGGRL